MHVDFEGLSSHANTAHLPVFALGHGCENNSDLMFAELLPQLHRDHLAIRYQGITTSIFPTRTSSAQARQDQCSTELSMQTRLKDRLVEAGHAIH